MTFFIARKYIKGKSPFLRVMSFLSTFGVCLGVGALITVLSVMSGLREAIREKILGTSPHIIITRLGGAIEGWDEIIEKIKKIEGVKSAFPLVIGNAILKHGEISESVVVQCVTENLIKDFEVKNFLKEGGIFESAGDILVGGVLKSNLDLKLESEVWLVSMFGRTTPFGFIPNTSKFRVGGVIELGIYDWDSVFVFVKLSDCKELFGLGNWVTSIGVFLKDPASADEISVKVSEELGFPFFAKPWTKTQKNLFAAMQLEKFGMSLLLTLIIIVASFNIFSTVTVLVREKSRDIAIMKTFGFTPKDLKRIFSTVGLWIGIKGTLLGIALGLVLCFIIKEYGIIQLPPDVYYISRLPVKVKIQDVLGSSVLSMVMSFLASYYPASKAAKAEPFEVLRFE